MESTEFFWFHGDPGGSPSGVLGCRFLSKMACASGGVTGEFEVAACVEVAGSVVFVAASSVGLAGGVRRLIAIFFTGIFFGWTGLALGCGHNAVFRSS